MNFSIRLITGLLAVCFHFPLFAQTFTVGTHDGQNNQNTYPTPFGDFRESTRSQYLYLSSELTAAGATAGNIIAVGFFVEDLNGAEVHENYTIKLLLTSSTTLVNGNWQNFATTVYGPVDYTPVAGLNTFDLNAPFYWNGASNANLVVEVCHAPPSNGNFASENASVQLTTGLAFNGSRTIAVPNDTDICSTTANDEDGIRTSRPVLSLTFCYPPIGLTVNSVTSVAANVSWSPPTGASPAGYDFTYGLVGYEPGVSGTEVGSGSVSGTGATAVGLSGQETYALWVRSDCGEGFSRWTGPLEFTTESSCGDGFFDTGGPVFSYGTDEDYVRVFCPDLAENAVTMNFFLPFSTGAGDTLRVYNGDNTGAPLVAALSGVYSLPDNPLPPPFTSTTVSGCLTVRFTSDDETTLEDLGWFAFLLCAPLPPDDCYEVLELDSANVSYETADFSWLKMFGAESYDWSLVKLPNFDPVQSETGFQGNAVSFTDLVPGTTYQFAVKTNCTNGESSDWVFLDFTTPVLCDGVFIQCDQTYSVVSEGTGIWNLLDCGTATPGKEQIFQFVPPNTRSYTFKVNTAVGSGYANYFYKPASVGCNDDSWNCIDDFNMPGTSSLPPAPGAVLNAGTLYYILLDAQTTDPLAQTFTIQECSPLNDFAVDAIEIQVNAPCGDNIYSNLDATLDPNEPDPDVDDSDGLTGRWLDGADKTVWFKFAAPASGTITIFTNPNGTQIPNDDTQVAMYEVGDPADFSTYRLLISDEDNGSANLGFNSVVSYTGLNEGEFYYIQVDGWGVNSGAFCIAVIETVERISESFCDADYTLSGVNQDEWYNIYATPDNLDIGPLVAAINPLGFDLGDVNCRVASFGSIPLSANGIPYLPLYYYFTSSLPLTPPNVVQLRLFYLNQEFADLKTAANEPDKTIGDLVVSRFDGAIADCNQLNNNGVSAIVNVNNAVQMVGTFYLELFTDNLGEFGPHLGLVPLPLQLKYFTGKTKDHTNLLEWVTLTEKNVRWHIVERSANGSTWAEVGRVAGQANTDKPLSYSLEDRQPLSKAYYRLRSVDFDGTASVSHSILLTRRSESFSIARVFPSPTANQLFVQFVAENEENVTIRLSDFTGRAVLEQTAVAGKGIAEVKLSLHQLPAGVYNVTIANSTSVSEPVRVVKQ